MGRASYSGLITAGSAYGESGEDALSREAKDIARAWALAGGSCFGRQGTELSLSPSPRGLAFRKMHGDAADKALARAIELGLEDNFEPVEAEINDLLPALVEAGYVETYGHSPTGFLWRYSRAGIERGSELQAWGDA